jgi:hypothetical protein
MMQLLTRYANIVLTITTGHRVWYHLSLLFLVHQVGYIVNLSDFYSYRLIGKLTSSLKFQEFCQCNQIVDSTTTSTRMSLSSSKEKLV